MADYLQFANLNEAEFYHKHIKLKVESGLPRTKYCKQHGLDYRKFGHYERKLSLSSDLLPINLIGEGNACPSKPQILCSVTFRKGTELKIHNELVLPTLLKLLW